MLKRAEKRSVLIVDDSSLNRAVLAKLLSIEYTVIETQNGREALEVLQNGGHNFSAILLDLEMPVMNGYEFLAALRTSAYNGIPVIVTTGNDGAENESRALELGAWDFVSKPYHPAILCTRLRNGIARSELTALEQLRYLSQYDKLTGLYNKSTFFEAMHQMIKLHPQKQYAFIRFDIDRFSLVNNYYGTDAGDALLRHTAECLSKYSARRGNTIYGHIEGDVFALCFPYTTKDEVEQVVYDTQQDFKKYPLDFDIVIAYGICLIDDNTLPAHMFLDRATLAAKQVKGNYVNCLAYYEPQMQNMLEAEQEIINEMTTALEQEQFCVYFQPKYDLQTNRPKGAEALVRWIHPTKGIISPGFFIPVFERNGFICKLDAYVWEKTCMFLKKQMDSGKMPYPISVNISRVNLYSPNLVDNLCALTEKYGIPRRLLQLELTESAYSDNQHIISETMKKLHANGFTTLMDDFGSGYSSLNVLKDIDIDILKIDMGFFHKSAEDPINTRAENIIAAVIRMAKRLHISTVAEGVERADQIAFLRDIGCEYVQGYFFAKPMPEHEYEELICRPPEEGSEEHIGFDRDTLWLDNEQIEILLTAVQQPIAIYCHDRSQPKLLRVNRAYYELFGCQDRVLQTHNPLSVLSEEDQATLLAAFDAATETAGESECEYFRLCADGSVKRIRMNLRCINKVGEKYILLGNLLDITAQVELMQQLEKYRSLRFASPRQGKILIVEDVEMNRNILRQIFARQFDVLEAANGQEALAVLEKHRDEVSVILLDLIMPVMDGATFLEHKKQNPAICDIPVVVISSNDSRQNQIDILRMGASDYIIKPFLPEAVMRRVQNVLDSAAHFQEGIREYNEMQERLQMDSLTRALNYAAAERKINEMLHADLQAVHTFIMTDIDNFKSINDTFGHYFGDCVLQEYTAALSSYFGAEGVVGRLGGDEFIVFLPQHFAETEITDLLEGLRATLTDLSVGGKRAGITVSMGYTFSGPQDDFEALYIRADHAMYEAKRLGKDQAFSNQPLNNTTE